MNHCCSAAPPREPQPARKKQMEIRDKKRDEERDVKREKRKEKREKNIHPPRNKRTPSDHQEMGVVMVKNSSRRRRRSFLPLRYNHSLRYCYVIIPIVTYPLLLEGGGGGLEPRKEGAGDDTYNEAEVAYRGLGLGDKHEGEEDGYHLIRHPQDREGRRAHDLARIETGETDREQRR